MNWKLIWKSLADADMRKKIFAVLGIVVVYRFMAHIPIPISDPQNVRQVLDSLFTSSNTPQFLSFLNALSGGALAKFSIMLVALGPYINASIIMQLLTRALPKLEALNKEGEYGRKKINQMTRMLTLPLAIIQSIGAIYIVKQQASQISGLNITAHSSIMQWVLMVCALTGGSMILMWLGELITEQNIGNGISILITVGIVSTLPGLASNLTGAVFTGNHKYNLLGHQIPFDWGGLKIFGLVLLLVIATIVIVVKLNEAARKLTVHYAKRVQGNRTYGGVTTVLPVKLIGAGVVPIIFAVAFLSVPSFIGQILTSSHNEKWQHLGTTLLQWFQTPSAQTFASGDWHSYIYPVTYFVLVFLFTFFYTNITFNAKEIAENLQKQGGFIDEVRSGPQTEKYLSKVVNRLTLFGGIAIGVLAVVPIAAEIFFGNNLAIGGTSVLILVSVSLETLRKVESQALMVTYSQYDGGDFFQQVDEEKKKRFNLKSLRRKK